MGPERKNYKDHDSLIQWLGLLLSSSKVKKKKSYVSRCTQLYPDEVEMNSYFILDVWFREAPDISRVIRYKT